jgi:hypothetical protein
MGAAGLSAANDATVCDAVCVIIDAIISSGAFQSLSFWNLVGIAVARLSMLQTSQNSLHKLVSEGTGSLGLTLDEVRCEV